MFNINDPNLDRLWVAFRSYEKDEICTPYIKSKQFDADYTSISAEVRDKMYSPDIMDAEMFSEFVGGDDGHDDLCDFIIWNGKEVTKQFLTNPSSAIPLAKRMSKHKWFDGDVNIIVRLSMRTRA